MVGQDFLARARHEARRYGSDPWVFIRELLQNARDAGARSVTIEAGTQGGTARVAFHDDGEGMTFDHARRYLFTLYASSKERDRGAAGRFGVGFWSVLRFDPVRLVVRSWPRRGPAWEVELDGALTQAATRTPPPRRGHGTEIVLERAAAAEEDLGRRVHDAAWQSGRFLARRDDRRRPLDVRVNGIAVGAAFDLPAPSAQFRKGTMRGVVALGSEARVELFAQGLRVRSASALEDLLSAEGSSELTRVRFPALADGVAPQAILDGDGFEPMLARADVRDTPELRRLVALGQRELRYLIERQIDAVRPRSWIVRVWRPAAAAALVATSALGGAWVARRGMPAAPVAAAPLLAAPTAVAPAAASPASRMLAYRDLGGHYEGPTSDRFPSDALPLALAYEPRERSLRFTSAVVLRPFAAPPAPVDIGPYGPGTLAADAVEVALAIDDGPGLLRLPVPTGHRLDPSSVRLAGRAVSAHRSAAGEPLVVLTSAEHGIVAYRTAPGVPPDAVPVSRPAAAPALAAVAETIRRQDPHMVVAAATGWVRGRVAYSTSEETVQRHREAIAAGKDLLTATLEIGAADCDVQNSVLVALLQASGIEARLAVGYVGQDGVALAPPHAWVEWRRADDGQRRWQIADASGASAPLAGRQALRMERPWSPPLPPSPEAKVVAWTLEQRWLPWLGLAGPVAGVVTIAGLLLFLRVRTRRAVRVAPKQDVAALLRGALQRPEAFREVPVVYRRPLVPRIDGRLVSLADAWQLATDRRLFRSARHSSLARRSLKEGAMVLDASRPEARAVADALGAVDLDEWDGFLRAARRSPLLEAAGERLRRLGQPCDLRATPGIGSPALLDLPSGGGVARMLVLDAGEPWLVAAESAFARRPRQAVLAVVDRVAEIVRWDDGERRAFLRPLAREALLEAAT